MQLDVAQGDAALLTTPEGRHILIDAGPRATEIVQLLAASGIDTVDLVIASHNHADHIGGMPGVLAAVVVRAYMENGLPTPTAIYARTLAAIEREPGLRFLDASDRTITVGSVTVRILQPPRIDDSQNNNSVGVIIEYGRFRAVFTGDAEHRALSHWVGRIGQTTVVKVGHHGSWNGTTPALVRATRPAVAVISVGTRNAYGHPSAQAEQLWRAAGAHVYRTDRDGSIEISGTRDGRFTVRTAASVERRAR